MNAPSSVYESSCLYPLLVMKFVFLAVMMVAKKESLSSISGLIPPITRDTLYDLEKEEGASWAPELVLDLFELTNHRETYSIGNKNLLL